MSALALLYAIRIMEGKNTFSEVPKTLKPSVKQVLVEQGFPELAE